MTPEEVAAVLAGAHDDVDNHPEQATDATTTSKAKIGNNANATHAEDVVIANEGQSNGKAKKKGGKLLGRLRKNSKGKKAV